MNTNIARATARVARTIPSCLFSASTCIVRATLAVALAIIHRPWLSSGFYNEYVHLPQNTDDIIGLFVRDGARYLRAKYMQRTTTDTQFTRKELLYLGAHGLADEYAARLRASLQNAGQVQD